MSHFEQKIDKAINKIEETLFHFHCFTLRPEELLDLRKALMNHEPYCLKKTIRLQNYPYLCNLTAKLNHRWFPTWAYLSISSTVGGIEQTYSLKLDEEAP